MCCASLCETLRCVVVLPCCTCCRAVPTHHINTHTSPQVPHFDGKGEVDKDFLASGVPTTLYETSFYMARCTSNPRVLPDFTALSSKSAVMLCNSWSVDAEHCTGELDLLWPGPQAPGGRLAA